MDGSVGDELMFGFIKVPVLCLFQFLQSYASRTSRLWLPSSKLCAPVWGNVVLCPVIVLGRAVNDRLFGVVVGGFGVQ